MTALLYPEPPSVVRGVSRWNARKGRHEECDIQLELLWQPLWHCRYIDALADTQLVEGIPFFHEFPRNSECGNLESGGALTWPGRFHCHELEFSFTTAPDESIVAVLLLGKKVFSQLPLSLYQRRVVKPWGYFTIFHAPIQLDASLTWRVSLCRSQKDFGNGIVTCALNGWLGRVVQ